MESNHKVLRNREELIDEWINKWGREGWIFHMNEFWLIDVDGKQKIDI